MSYMDGDKKKVLSDDKMPWSLVELPPGVDTLNLKNLGSQVTWHMVFYIEYLGPILILPLLYFLGRREEYTSIQTVALVLGVLQLCEEGTRNSLRACVQS